MASQTTKTTDHEDWFEKFEASGLAFLYQQRKAGGEDSTFFKLVSREDS